jgi:hypothetical protein
MFVAGRLSEERKELYNRQDNQEYCRINPDKCLNGNQNP